ncbi:MAG TPA: NAD(P)-binding domain-containing protein [Terriglobales bacterium]
MKIGFLGAGEVAQTFAKHFLPFGHQVVLSNSRGPDSLSDVIKELGAGATAGTLQQAAEQDIVVLATKWHTVQSVLFTVPDWNGRILVDTTNRVASYSPLILGDISGRTSSEIVADLAPGARVVKAFNAVPMIWLQDFSPSKPKTTMFVSGDDANAKKILSDLIDEVGFCSLDLGSLADGGRLFQLGGPLLGVNLSLVDRFVLPKNA